MNPDAKPPAKRRPWFQVHLSTCVVLMFVAGGLIWANTTERRGHLEGWVSSTTPELKDWVFQETSVGWPLLFHKWHPSVGKLQPPLRPPGSSMERPRRDDWGPPDPSWSFVALAADLALALAVVALVGFLCEWRIRRLAETPSP